MTDLLANSPNKDLLNTISGLDRLGGNERLKPIVRRIVGDLFKTIEAFDVTPTEFWAAISFLTQVGQRHEFGLVAPSLGFEHLLDLMMDEKERKAGIEGGTPRTIEGPLYLAGAPLSQFEARLDDGNETGEVLIAEGQVLDHSGQPVAHAIVDVWHADTKGGYSFFDPSQPAWNLRRRIETDAHGRYRFRSILPAGYGCPPDGPTQQLMDLLGRHARRPAHIHFFVEAAGFRKLTTQINIAGDPYTYNDFAFATRDELVVEAVRQEDPAEMAKHGLNAPFSHLRFDFTLNRDAAGLPDAVVVREHASA